MTANLPAQSPETTSSSSSRPQGRGQLPATPHNRRETIPITLTSTSSHLVPTSSIDQGRPQGRPRPSSPSLPGGRGRRDVDDDHTLTTSSSPPRDEVTITALCPTHGRQTFLRCEQADLWLCPGQLCLQAILDEHVTPDGADVVDLNAHGWDHLALWLVARLEKHAS